MQKTHHRPPLYRDFIVLYMDIITQPKGIGKQNKKKLNFYRKSNFFLSCNAKAVNNHAAKRYSNY
ncbi:hypothetical protein COT95_00140 [Candidatus Falkowbacteria bacterium CG10_big_fil_rev_8_21_14_0_10_37_6]|uniref:Uncharacterized protein n=1 Tax=Candidatus Falkowbacteria bacterium CG10_big_fil_rev_8_21_14_0_10_37_6 TaxID=1974563 RepID=A0A2H0VA25_9BACT|nr:MAG: hypothetical protein COT95_00140 [Candidatus Falkowbacteria bacterium CG10_big_fil_rev_8_21_14_0_10_37_6]